MAWAANDLLKAQRFSKPVFRKLCRQAETIYAKESVYPVCTVILDISHILLYKILTILDIANIHPDYDAHTRAVREWTNAGRGSCPDWPAQGIPACHVLVVHDLHVKS